MKDKFQEWPAKNNSGQRRYDLQGEMIEEALADPNHQLNRLIELMRKRGESAVYLCGTRLDSRFGFGSNDLGTAISVLPEDGDKAADPGYHPGSTEVYTIFQGSLVIDLLDRGHLRAQNCGQFDVAVIPPGQCHRVRHEPDRPAASFIVKTNPHHKPGVVRCDECTQYTPASTCPVRADWLHERTLVLEAQLRTLKSVMDSEIADLERNCPSRMYEDHDDGSSSYSEILHAGATSTHVAAIRDRYRAKADGLVEAWKRKAGKPEMEEIAEDAGRAVGIPSTHGAEPGDQDRRAGDYFAP